MPLNTNILLITGSMSFLTATVRPWRRRLVVTLDHQGFSGGRPMVWTSNKATLSFQQAFDLSFTPITRRNDLQVKGFPARFGPVHGQGPPVLRIGCQCIPEARLTEVADLLLAHQAACEAQLWSWARPLWRWLTK